MERKFLDKTSHPTSPGLRVIADITVCQYGLLDRILQELDANAIVLQVIL
jgi:hypothetical protein